MDNIWRCNIWFLFIVASLDTKLGWLEWSHPSSLHSHSFVLFVASTLVHFDLYRSKIITCIAALTYCNTANDYNVIQRYNLVSTLALHGTLSVTQMLTHLQRAPRTCTARNAVLRQCHSTSGGNVEFSHPGFTQWILNVQNPCDIASYCFTRVPINAHCDPHHVTFRASNRETFQIRVINLDKLG